MDNESIQEQIKSTFAEKLSKSTILSKSETAQICGLLYQKTTVDKTVESMFKIIGGDLNENTPT